MPKEGKIMTIVAAEWDHGQDALYAEKNIITKDDTHKTSL